MTDNAPTGLIPLHGASPPGTRGQGPVIAHAIVDAADYSWLMQWRWYRAEGYAACSVGPAKRRRTLRLHRVILGVTDPAIKVDHVNGDKLDNRRSNLRCATEAQNHQNLTKLVKTNTSGYRGVSWDRPSRKWRAYAMIDQRNHQLGYFTDVEEAARVAAAFRAEHMPFSKDARAAEKAA